MRARESDPGCQGCPLSWGCIGKISFVVIKDAILHGEYIRGETVVVDTDQEPHDGRDALIRGTNGELSLARTIAIDGAYRFQASNSLLFRTIDEVMQICGPVTHSGRTR